MAAIDALQKDEVVSLNELTKAYNIIRNPPQIFKFILPNPETASRSLLLDAKKHAYDIYKIVEKLTHLSPNERAMIGLTPAIEAELRPAENMRTALEAIEAALTEAIRLAATPNYVQGCNDFDIVTKRISQLIMSIRRALELQKRAKLHLNAVLHVELDEGIVLKELLNMFRLLANTPHNFNNFLKDALKNVESAERNYDAGIGQLYTAASAQLASSPHHAALLITSSQVPAHLAAVKEHLTKLVANIDEHQTKEDSFAKLAESLGQLRGIEQHLAYIIELVKQFFGAYASRK